MNEIETKRLERLWGQLEGRFGPGDRALDSDEAMAFFPEWDVASDAGAVVTAGDSVLVRYGGLEVWLHDVEVSAAEPGTYFGIIKDDLPRNDIDLKAGECVGFQARHVIRVKPRPQNEKPPEAPAHQTWTPLGPVSSAFFVDNSPRPMLVGPVGSGKSVTVCLRIQRHIVEQEPGNDGVARSRVLVVRQTFRQLEDTTIPTLLAAFDGWGTWVPTKRMFVVDLVVNGKRVYAEIICRALDDAQDIKNLLGLELGFAWVNEAREVPYEVYAAIGGRVGRFPSPISGAGPTYAGVLGDTNCWSTDSQYHEKFVLAPPLGYQLFRQPGGLSPGAENLGNLRQSAVTLRLPHDHPERLRAGRAYYLDLERDLDSQEFRILGCAEFGVSRSKQACYPDYNDSVHCTEFPTPRGGGLIVGIDVGIRASAAVFLHRTPDGRFFVLDEVVCFDKDLASFVGEIKRTLARYPECFVERTVVDPAASARDLTGKSGIELLRACGVQALPAPTNAISARLACVGQLLRTLARDGTPAFKLHPRCSWLRKGFVGGYAFAKSRAGQYADKPGDSDFTHCHDGLAYAALAATGTLTGAMGTTGYRPPPAWPTDGQIVVHKDWPL